MMAHLNQDSLAYYRQGPLLQRMEVNRHVGRTPAIVLLQPKYEHNVGGALRNAVAYGVPQVWMTGNRVTLDDPKHRLPREERMKTYGGTRLYAFDRPLDCFAGAVPVCVEVSNEAERLHDFVHPANALYVFGPEDGHVAQAIRARCHRFVTIPTAVCLNLATAVATVLYDRAHKEWEASQL